MVGTLYIVATPIGNLEDITLRALKTLGGVDIILAEDTRVTKKLLDHYSSPDMENSDFYIPGKTSLLSYHQHSGEEKKLEILKYLMDGKNIALVTDAGTPGVSDPGNELIEFLLAYNPNIKIVPIPGVSAITSLLSVSGFDTSKYIFLGFWPKKKASKSLQLVKAAGLPFVYFDSPFRVVKNLRTVMKEFPYAKVVVGRELTKMYETIYRGDIKAVINALEAQRVRGEISILVVV